MSERSLAAETFGRYRLLERIGRGGMAEVFKAKSFGVEGFEKVLVIKRIVPELAAHPQFVELFVELFVREAKLAVQLSHPNIVQVFDLGRIEAAAAASWSFYIAMEYVPGLDLASLLSQKRRDKQLLPLGLAVFVTTEVAKALAHAHRRTDEQQRSLGIVHRDISPHNILLSWDGDVKVTDFGIAKAADTIAPTEAESELSAVRATGKVAHMSPEQSRAEETDARSDLFSLGIVLYEMITGANPFLAPTDAETIRRIRLSECPPVRLARADAPGELTQIVDRLLQPLPADRFASAAELCEHLLAFTYTSGVRFTAADLAELLAPLAKSPEASEIEPASVLEAPPSAIDRTPVEIPHTSVPPATLASADSAERREVSALVLSLGARSAEGELSQHLLRVRQVLHRHGARIEEETPQQVVAIFGLGEADGRDAETAVLAGLVLVRERHAGAAPSVGIHSGAISIDAAEGVPLNDERLISLLASAQALSRSTEGQVAVSRLTGRLVRRRFSTEPLPESVRAYTDGGLVVTGAHTSEGRATHFVDRKQELKRLGSILGAATAQVPQLVVVRGATGIGKTRLLQEAWRRLRRGKFNVAFYAATCPANGTTMPWSGLRAMLHGLCGTQEDDDVQRILEVRPRLRALGLRDEQVAAVLSLLGAPLRSHAAQLSPVLPAAFERMALGLCRDQLHCFAWDDAQSIDQETLATILRVLRLRRRLRGVFILVRRGEIPPVLAAHPSLHDIQVDELSDRHAAQLSEALLGARTVPSDLLAYVHKCAGGHPLFIEELLRELRDTGAIQVLSGAVTSQLESRATAPRPLRALIASRVARLSQRDRRVLQGLGVLGEPAFTPVLASILDLAIPALDRSLADLETEGLVRRHGPTKVRFGSPLYQEIVLDTIPSPQRQELHGKAAATYEAANLRVAGETSKRIAQHLLEAGERERAVDYFWHSATEKIELGQPEPAIAAILRGLELAELKERSVDELGEQLRTLSAIVSQVRSAPGLQDIVPPALREISERGSEHQRVLAHIDVARALGAINLFDEAFAALERGGADALGGELQQAGLLAEIELCVRQGLFVRGAAAADRLEAVGEVADGQALLLIAQVRAATGESDLALELMDRVDALSEPADALEATTRQKHRVLVCFNRGDFAQAVAEATKLVELARAARLRYEMAAALHNLGDACQRMGDRPRAYAALVESLELCQLIEHERLSALNRMHLSFLDSLRDVAGAEDRLKSLIRYADSRGYVWDVIEGRWLLGRLHLERGAHDEARAHLTEVLALADEHGHRLLGDDARRLLTSLP